MFSRGPPVGERRSASCAKKGERGIWQRRYWEHTLRDEEDFARHADYIHFNPVKHGHVSRVRDWPYSSFHRMVRFGVYPLDWRAMRSTIARVSAKDDGFRCRSTHPTGYPLFTDLLTAMDTEEQNKIADRYQAINEVSEQISRTPQSN
jgi:hypothetical protein